MENETVSTTQTGRDDVFFKPLPFRIPSREEFHRRYGGHICNSDYDRHTYISDIADRIGTDTRFDNFCQTYNRNKKNFTRKERNNKWLRL